MEKEGFKCLTACKQSLNALKNRWLGRVAATVALERPAESLREGLKGLKGLKAFEGKQTAGLNAQQMAIVAGGLRKGLRGLKTGKRQS